MSLNEQPKIVVYGTIPLYEYVEAMERQEQEKKDAQRRKEIIRETFGDIPAVKGSIYFKPHKVGTPVTKVLNSRVYDIKDQIGYLLTRSGHRDLLSQFMLFAPRKKQQIERLLKLFRKLKEKSFYLADAIVWLKCDICADPHRDLLLLQQAGVLSRAEEHGYVVYNKSVMNESDALVSIISNSNNLVGYVSAARAFKKNQKIRKPSPPPVQQSTPVHQTRPAHKSAFEREQERFLAELTRGFKGGDIDSYVQSFLQEKFQK